MYDTGSAYTSLCLLYNSSAGRKVFVLELVITRSKKNYNSYFEANSINR
jgi:hypothetical protein